MNLEQKVDVSIAADRGAALPLHTHSNNWLIACAIQMQLYAHCQPSRNLLPQIVMNYD